MAVKVNGATRNRGEGVYVGRVVTIDRSKPGDPDGGVATVEIEGVVHNARLTFISRGAKVGDLVEVHKPGAVYWVHGVTTDRPPGSVDEVGSGSIPGASGVSGSTATVSTVSRQIPWPSGSSNANLYSNATDLYYYLSSKVVVDTSRLATAVNSLISRVDALEARVRANANSQNAQRAAINEARDAARQIREVMYEEGMVE